MSEEKNESMEQESVGSIVQLPLDKLKEFKNHPFKTYEGEELDRLIADIKESGVLVPIIVRPIKTKRGNNSTLEWGGYEILSGHNRVKAAKAAELETIPAEIRDVDDEQAIVIVNKTNLQQRSFEKWLPSEKAQSIAQFYESIKRQGERSDLQSSTSGENQQKSDDKDESRAKAAKIYGVKENIIVKYLQLNKLIPPLKDRLDMKKIDFGSVAATQIALLPENEQKIVESVLTKGEYKLTVDRAKQIRELSKDKNLTVKSVEAVLKKETEGVNDPKPYTIKPDLMSKYFVDVPSEEIEAELIKALELYRSQSE